MNNKNCDNSSKKKSWDSDKEMRNMSNTAADVFAGMSEAMGKGFRTFQDEVNSKSATRAGRGNGMMQGTMKGMFKALEEGARAAREAWEGYSDEEETSQSSSSNELPEIDYERLAKLVAAELSKSKENPS